MRKIFSMVMIIQGPHASISHCLRSYKVVQIKYSTIYDLSILLIKIDWDWTFLQDMQPFHLQLLKMDYDDNNKNSCLVVHTMKDDCIKQNIERGSIRSLIFYMVLGFNQLVNIYIINKRVRVLCDNRLTNGVSLQQRMKYCTTRTSNYKRRCRYCTYISWNVEQHQF